MKKREFIKSLGAMSALSLINPMDIFAGNSLVNSKKNVLILGGRDFMGPRIVEAFLKAGYEVTLLNRNKTNTHLFKNLPLIICDRETENKAGLKAIDKPYKNTYWDIVVDTWQKSPKAVADFLDEFKDRIGHYHYISTVSVYDKWDKKFIIETEPLNPLPTFPKTIQEEHRYAIRKTFAEEAIREKTDKYTIYRSHGMHDERITHSDDPDAEPFWPVRFYRGGEILLPKAENHHVQLTDVSSLANFLVHCSEQNTYGEFNVAYDATPFKDYVASLIMATQMPKAMHWIDGEFLINEGLKPYEIVPLWKPAPAGSYYFNVQKAINAGLINRSMVDMISDQIKGYKSRHPQDDVRFGELIDGKQIKYYSEAKEKEIIRKWLSR